MYDLFDSSGHVNGILTGIVKTHGEKPRKKTHIKQNQLMFILRFSDAFPCVFFFLSYD